MNRSEGFTLLEVLVTLVVLGLLLGGLLGGTRLTLTLVDTQTRVVATTRDLDAADRVLRQLLAGAEPGRMGMVPLRGTAGTMEFASQAPQATLAEIWLGNVEGRLTLRLAPVRFGQHFSSLPPPYRDSELAQRIERIELSYWSAAGWQASWAMPDLPALVRLRVIFPSGDGRHWPDMVFATERLPTP